MFLGGLKFSDIVAAVGIFTQFLFMARSLLKRLTVNFYRIFRASSVFCILLMRLQSEFEVMT